MSGRGLPGVAAYLPDPRLQQVQSGGIANQMRNGKINPGPDMLLRANQTTTEMIDPRLSPDSVVALDPTTANAAAALATTYCTIANRQVGKWTFTHSSAATTDRLFKTAIWG